MLSRILNSFVAAINKKIYLPDYLIIVLDDDLIEFLQYQKIGVSTLYDNWLEFIAGNVTQALDIRCKQLPLAVVGKDSTQVYWVEPAPHYNFCEENKQMREKFSMCLDYLCKIYDNMRVLIIRSPWNKEGGNLVINDCFTRTGLTTYWKTIDASFRFNVSKRE